MPHPVVEISFLRINMRRNEPFCHLLSKCRVDSSRACLAIKIVTKLRTIINSRCIEQIEKNRLHEEKKANFRLIFGKERDAETFAKCPFS